MTSSLFATANTGSTSYATTPPHMDDDDGEIGRLGAKKGGLFTSIRNQSTSMTSSMFATANTGTTSYATTPPLEDDDEEIVSRPGVCLEFAKQDFRRIYNNRLNRKCEELHKKKK
jgi:hypothetical protein